MRPLFRILSPVAVLALASLVACKLPPVSTTPSPEARKSALSVKRKLPKVPERVNLLLPPGVALIAAGAGNLKPEDRATLIGNDTGSLIGNDAGSLIGNDAGSLIGNDAGSLIGMDGASLLAGEAGRFQLAQASDCADGNASAGFIELVGLAFSPYVKPVVIANRLLRAIKDKDLLEDEPFPFETPDGKPAVAILKALNDTTFRLRISDGAVFDPTKLRMVLDYSSASKGRLVYRTSDNEAPLGNYTLTTTFDLAAGTATGEGAADTTHLPNNLAGYRARAHWEFRAPQGDLLGAVPKNVRGIIFSMQTAAGFHFPASPCDSGARAMTLRFNHDHRGAARMGRVPVGKTFGFSRTNGQGYGPEEDDTTAFFIDQVGQQLAVEKADAALRSALPTRKDIYEPFPETPETGDPLVDAVFSFPE